MMKIVAACMVDVGVLLWFQRKNNRKNRFIFRIISAYLLMILTVIQTQKLTAEALHYRVLITFLYYYLANRWLYQCEEKRKFVTRSILLVLSIIVSELLATVCVMLAAGINDSVSFTNDGLVLLCLQGMAKTIEIFLLNMINEIDEMKKKSEPGKLCLYVLFFLCIYYLFYCMLLCLETQNIEVINKLLTGNIVFINIILIGFLSYIKLWKGNLLKSNAIEQMKITVKYQYEYYEELAKIRDELYFIYHELLHFILKDDTMKEGRKEERFQKFEEYIEQFAVKENITVQTGSSIVDAFLIKAKNTCEKRQIIFFQSVEFPEAELEDAMEIMNVFILAVEEGIRWCMDTGIGKELYVAAGKQHGLYMFKIIYTGFERNDKHQIEEIGKRDILKKNQGKEFYQVKDNNRRIEHVLCFNLKKE